MLEFWTRHAHVLSRGLNNCGTIDRQLLRAMRLFRLLVHDQSAIRRMLSFDDLASQTEYYRRHCKSWRWECSHRLLLNSILLRAVYGQAILERLPSDFAMHLCEQVNRAFVGSLSSTNPYLWQTFMPHVPPPTDEPLPLHMRGEKLAACKPLLDRLTCVTGDAVKVIAEADVPVFHLAALSNILKVVSPDYADALAEALGRKMRPGGIVLLRFFFPPPQAFRDPFSKHLSLDSALARACAAAEMSTPAFHLFDQAYQPLQCPILTSPIYVHRRHSLQSRLS